MNKEDAIKAINDEYDKFLRMYRRGLEKKPDRLIYYEGRFRGLKLRRERQLKNLKELLEKAESLGIDESEFLIARGWLRSFFFKFFSKSSPFSIRALSDIHVYDIDEKFVHRVNLAKKWEDEKKWLDKEDEPFRRKYQDDFRDFFGRYQTSLRGKGHYSKEEKKQSYYPLGKSKNEWSRQGMNPADQDAPDDWENYRTDELID